MICNISRLFLTIKIFIFTFIIYDFYNTARVRGAVYFKSISCQNSFKFDKNFLFSCHFLKKLNKYNYFEGY